jgi:hypothetical protein
LSPWLTKHGLERVLSVPIHSEQATGRLLVFSYIAAPVTSSFRKAFREE